MVEQGSENWLVNFELIAQSCENEKNTSSFIENSAYFVLEIELLLTVLSNFKREATLWWLNFLMLNMFDP